MSKLIVEVCKVKSIEKHPNADKLSIVSMENNDWNCIVSLDQYKIGDLVVYCPVDSIIPEDIVEKYNLEYLKNGARVRTVKLRGYISQGLILDIPQPMGASWKEGLDVASELGITKWEPPIPKYQQVRGQVQGSTKKKRNPDFDKYTNIENIKNYNNVFKEGEMVVITEKIHGTNFRAGNLPIHPGYSFIDRIKYWINKYISKKSYEFVYGSHNVQIVSSSRKGFYGEDIYGAMAKRYKLAEVIPEDYIVYGEIFGQGVQDLEYGYKGKEMRVFDVKYKGKYLDWGDVVEFCLYRELLTVPILTIEPFSVNTLAEYTDGNSSLCSNQLREGCVIKTVKEENNTRIGRKILKSVSQKYLLRKDATEYK